ncbi:hypothetical protein [Flavobacterium sp. GSB-24]|uniref:hypothetical protein n=1 Tax=Flavobacterium sp. GSB-24 TaxID=2994319 RepID=UPI00248FDFA5|nr:hypothetical protein [Flavobacterium sp. GSB-24]BDU26279.1 hypothetical protein FLGSB24_30230 [Flavobacterium sp. GSB-24]
MSKKNKAGEKKFIDQMLKLTFRICHWNDDGTLTGRSSGFLYRKSQDSPVLVITAGHGTPQKGSFIETKHVHDNKTAVISTGEFKIFYQEGGIDYAYSVLPLEFAQNSETPKMSFEFICYQGAFVQAVKDEAYGFAVLNNFEFLKSGDQLLLPQYLCHELYLELEKQDDLFNYFKPSREINPHEYYEGASGSPIADPEGKICSILIGGTDPIELLRAFRLDNIELPEN